MPKREKPPEVKSPDISRYFIRIGMMLIVLSLFLFILIFYPVVSAEISYDIKSVNTSQTPDKKTELIPVDENFGILIPKIMANAKVIKDVDPFNSQIYQRLLTKGVAHAKGSSLPDKSGNVFIFAHSSDNWYNANRYNSVFYLLNKLEKGDEIDLYYEGKKYKYLIDGKKLEDPSQVKYLSSYYSYDTLTLMTCWPPGTTLKRLLVFAQKVK